MNGEYIKAMDMDRYLEYALPVIKEVITKDYDLTKIAELVKTRIELFPRSKEKIDFFEELPEYDTAMYTHKKMKTNSENSLEVLKEMLPLFLKHRKIIRFRLLKHFVKIILQKRNSKTVVYYGRFVQRYPVSR